MMKVYTDRRPLPDSSNITWAVHTCWTAHVMYGTLTYFGE